MAECHGDIKSPAKDQEECKIGRCDSDCLCTNEYEPMCCMGIDYDNECIANCHIDTSNNAMWCNTGTCYEHGHCTLEYEPVCCTKGREEITYANQCVADKMMQKYVMMEHVNHWNVNVQEIMIHIVVI